MKSQEHGIWQAIGIGCPRTSCCFGVAGETIPLVSTFNPDLDRVSAGCKRPGMSPAAGAGWQALHLLACGVALSGLESEAIGVRTKHRSSKKLRQCQSVVLEITAYHETNYPGKSSPKKTESKGVRPVSSFEVVALCVPLIEPGGAMTDAAFPAKAWRSIDRVVRKRNPWQTYY